jgi:hypothetical protein
MLLLPFVGYRSNAANEASFCAHSAKNGGMTPDGQSESAVDPSRFRGTTTTLLSVEVGELVNRTGEPATEIMVPNSLTVHGALHKPSGSSDSGTAPEPQTNRTEDTDSLPCGCLQLW